MLLDTSVIIDFLRKKEKKDTLLYRLSTEDLFISILTYTELYSGRSVWERIEAQKELEALFSGITILPLLPEISKAAGEIKAYNHDRSLLDCIIAATALTQTVALVTLNTKDFETIRGLKVFHTKQS